MTFLMISSSVEVDLHKRIVTLPKVPIADFTSKLSPAPTSADYLRSIIFYLSPEDRANVTKLLYEGNIPTIKFKANSFRCRLFVQMPSNNTSNFSGVNRSNN